jgi:hypothetical protein
LRRGRGRLGIEGLMRGSRVEVNKDLFLGLLKLRIRE